MSEKEQPQAARKSSERLISNKMHLINDKSFDVPDTFPSCYGLYFSADSIGICPECEYGYRCYIMSMGR